MGIGTESSIFARLRHDAVEVSQGQAYKPGGKENESLTLHGGGHRFGSADRGQENRGVVWNVLLLTMNFLLRPRNHVGQIRACFRGTWHGVTGNIAARY